jgi:dTMP kinase
LTFLLDCPVAVGLGRTSRRASVEGQPREDRFERETIEFHEKIRAGFLAMARADAARFRIVDASRSADEVAREIQRIADQEI